MCLPMRTLSMVDNPMFFMLLETAFPWGSSKAGKGMMSMEARNFMVGYRLVF